MSSTTALISVIMPRLSDSMEEGTVVSWLVADGAIVKAGEAIVEIETDKATVSHEAETDGTIRLVVPEGSTVPLGTQLAIIAPTGVAFEETSDESTEQSASPVTTPDANANGGAAVLPPSSAQGEVERIRASPVARRMARERGIDLSTLTGTGRAGRITIADLHTARDPEPVTIAPASASAPPVTVPRPQPQPPVTGAKGQVASVDPSRQQVVIARRMAESKATAPEFVISRQVDMEEAFLLREAMRAGAGNAPLPSFNDLVVKASALALHEVPEANAAYRDGRFERYSRVNVGVAVAGDDTLLVPTVVDADRKSLGEIARETRRLAERCRDGTVTPPELAGATFSISNLGMFSIDHFTAVLNPPQAAILAVGALKPSGVVHEGQLVVRRTMWLSLTCDHRILYGAHAAALLNGIVDHLEHPWTLVL
ncbi:MAG: 2-oxo acid dehydrogenase subunit [Solirubrobacterales bacterium]|nr:2-oxo acid dehydrogenase subunit [Solirubrobacterales bacterium]